MVGDSVLGIVVGPYLLASVKSCHLGFALRLLLFHRPPVLDLKYFLLQQICGPFLVGILTALFLDEDGQTCRNMDGSAG
jgi:hypothetical protein